MSADLNAMFPEPEKTGPMQALAKCWEAEVNSLQASPFVVAHTAFVFFEMACQHSGLDPLNAFATLVVRNR